MIATTLIRKGTRRRVTPILLILALTVPAAGAAQAPDVSEGGIRLAPEASRLATGYSSTLNNGTTLEFNLPSSSWVDVDVLDGQGNRVRMLMSQLVSGGSHEARWNGLDDTGRALAAGTYLVRIRSSFGVRTGKMILAT